MTSQVFTSTNIFYLVCAQHFFKISLSPEHSHHGFHIFCNYLKVSSVCKGFPCFKLTKKRASFGTLKHPKHITLLKTAYFWLQNIKEKKTASLYAKKHLFEQVTASWASERLAPLESMPKNGELLVFGVTIPLRAGKRGLTKCC